MATINFHSQFLALTLLLIHVVNSTIQATNHGFEIDLIHRDSPNSPLYNPNQTPLECYNDAFRRAYSRLNRLNVTSFNPNAAYSNVSANNGEYLMKFSMGTPPVDIYGIVDTGLGGRNSSLVSQVCSKFGTKKFSHCLVPFHTDPSLTSKMYFGSNSEVSGPGVVSTPLVPKDGKITFYFVTLEGTSVGDKFIPYNSSQPISKGNMLIDSGTPPTLLRKDFYKRLEDKVRGAIKLTPYQDPHLGTQLCYKSQSVIDIDAPILTAHFDGGGKVPLIQTSTFIPPLEGVFCFAMQPIDDGDDVGIFGNFAQSSLLIDYDLDKQIKTTFQGLSLQEAKRDVSDLFIAEKKSSFNYVIRGLDITARTAGASKNIEVDVDKPLGLTLGQKSGGGVVITAVESGGNAARAGLKAGDQPDTYVCPQCQAPKKRFSGYDANTGKAIGGGLPPIGVIIGLVAGVAGVGALLVYGLQ
ncbi:hypothetical protein EZV62_024555 [Acer yangbiense]|uniref:Peptidase A1 domain-containing protein n=1 Tax=Acer yangbiense TaxID=1000413 RepID=A0A5C7GVK2_9ROSI|nr:hypothetical protein EZV62_024555 [Acer yangbiense]